MAMILTGLVQGMRPVEGIVEEGKRKGEKWAFLSMEITDTRYGKVYSCQVREDDPQYADYIEGADLKAGKLAKDKDLSGHKVKVTIVSQTAGERELADKRIVMQIRSQVTNVRDMGIPKDDDE